MKTITTLKLKEAIDTDTTYTQGSNINITSNNVIKVKSTVSGLNKLTVGTTAGDIETGLETNGKVIASRIDSNGIKDLLYLNNAGGTSAESGIIFRIGTNNFVTRFDGTNYKIGSSNDIFDGALTEYMRINDIEMKISGDCNLTSTHQYKIDDTAIPNSILADNGLNLSSGVLKINIASCASQSTLGVDDIFIFQLNTGGITKKIKVSELITAINTDTNTTYLLGNNLSFDHTTTPHTINLDTALTNMSKISSSSGNFEIGSENQIKFYSDENGNNGGGDFVWLTSKTSGGLAQQLMRITGSTGNVVMNGESLSTCSLTKEFLCLFRVRLQS